MQVKGEVQCEWSIECIKQNKEKSSCRSWLSLELELFNKYFGDGTHPMLFMRADLILNKITLLVVLKSEFM